MANKISFYLANPLTLKEKIETLMNVISFSQSLKKKFIEQQFNLKDGYSRHYSYEFWKGKKQDWENSVISEINLIFPSMYSSKFKTEGLKPVSVDRYDTHFIGFDNLLGEINKKIKLLDSFLADLKKEAQEEKRDAISQEFNIENFYGQLAGINYGNMKQKSAKNAIEAIKELSKVILDYLPKKIQKEALADTITLKAQIGGGRPDKSIMKKTLKKLTSIIKGSLQHGAEIAQIYSIVIQPHLAEIQKFIDSISPHSH